MTNQRILSNLSRYFREMSRDATAHDKIILAASIAIVAGCAAGTYRGLIASKQWSIVAALLLGLVAGTFMWILGFGLGIKLRAPTWRDVFPPYQLIARGTIPAVVVGIAVGCVLGPTLFGVTLSRAAGVSFLGQVLTLVVLHFLFVLHTPVTRKAVSITNNPNIMTVDSHRYMWLFLALGVLAVFLLGRAVVPPDSEQLRHVGVTAAMATSIVLAGFGSGYIP